MTVTDALSILVISLAPFSVLSVAILVYYAWKRPRYGLLTERAWIGAAIALMVTSGALITYNRMGGYNLFPIEVSRFLFTASLVMLAFVPVVWLYLLVSGRLGNREQGEDA